MERIFPMAVGHTLCAFWDLNSNQTLSKTRTYDLLLKMVVTWWFPVTLQRLTDSLCHPLPFEVQDQAENSVPLTYIDRSYTVFTFHFR